MKAINGDNTKETKKREREKRNVGHKTQKTTNEGKIKTSFPSTQWIIQYDLHHRNFIIYHVNKSSFNDTKQYKKKHLKIHYAIPKRAGICGTLKPNLTLTKSKKSKRSPQQNVKSKKTDVFLTNGRDVTQKRSLNIKIASKEIKILLGCYLMSVNNNLTYRRKLKIPKRDKPPIITKRKISEKATGKCKDNSQSILYSSDNGKIQSKFKSTSALCKKQESLVSTEKVKLKISPEHIVGVNKYSTDLESENKSISIQDIDFLQDKGRNISNPIIMSKSPEQLECKYAQNTVFEEKKENAIVTNLDANIRDLCDWGDLNSQVISFDERVDLLSSDKTDYDETCHGENSAPFIPLQVKTGDECLLNKNFDSKNGKDNIFSYPHSQPIISKTSNLMLTDLDLSEDMLFSSVDTIFNDKSFKTDDQDVSDANDNLTNPYDPSLECLPHIANMKLVQHEIIPNSECFEEGKEYFGFEKNSMSLPDLPFDLSKNEPEENIEPEWDYDLSYFYTADDDDDFNIYSSDPFLMQERNSFDNKSSFYSEYTLENSYCYDDFNFVPSSETSTNYINYNVSDVSHHSYTSNPSADLYRLKPIFCRSYYNPYLHEISSYQDILREFALMSIKPRKRRVFNLDDPNVDIEEDSQQTAWFDVVSSNTRHADNKNNNYERGNFTGKITSTEIHQQNNLASYDADKNENINSPSNKSNHKINPEVFPQSTFPFDHPLHVEGFWNNPILKAREFYDKNSRKREQVNSDNMSFTDKNLHPQSLSLIQSEISKIEKRYRNRIHRVNDVYLADIKEDVNEVKEEKFQNKENEMSDEMSDKDSIKYIDISLSTKEIQREKYISEVKILKSPKEDIHGASLMFGLLNDEDISKSDLKLDPTLVTEHQLDTKYKDDFINTEVCGNSSDKREVHRNETDLKHFTEANENFEVFPCLEICEEEQHNSVYGDGLPDLLPNPTSFSSDHPSEPSKTSTEGSSSSRRKPNFVKSGSFSYTSINPVMSASFERKSGSLKITRTISDSNPCSSMSRNERLRSGIASSFLSIFGRFVGHKQKKEEKKRHLPKIKFRPFKNSI